MMKTFLYVLDKQTERLLSTLIPLLLMVLLLS